MNKSKINLFQVRSFDRSMNVSIEFLKQNILNIFKIILVLIPFLLISTFLMSKFQGSIFELQGIDLLYYFVAYIATMIIVQIASIIIIAYMVVYSQSDDGKVDPSLVWEKVKNSVLPLTGGFFLYYIAIVFGMFLLIIPGIIISVRWIFFSYVYIAEGKSLSGSFSRSSQLVKNNWWRIFGFFLVIYIVAMIIGSLLSLPFALPVALAPYTGSDIASNTTFMAISSFFSSIANLIVQPIIYVAIGIMYYSRRTDVDKTDLGEQIELLGTPDIQ